MMLPRPCVARGIENGARRVAFVAFALLGLAGAAGAATITVGSKNFPENRLLGEMFAQLLEARTGLTVERRLGLAGTQVCFEALKTGAIHVYPEYTGTGLVTLLEHPPMRDPEDTLARVRADCLSRWNIWWLAPLGFENAYELAVPRALAAEHGLRTISDLARLAPKLHAGLGYEFIERADGLPGLEITYGLRFRQVQAMQQALKYQAAGAGAIDCLDVYTTDGRLLVHDLVVLEDDQRFFPPYTACAVVNGGAIDQFPALGTLGLLSGALDEGAMRQLNLRLQEGGEDEAAVARDALEGLGLVGAGGEAPSTPRTGGWADRWLSQAPSLVKRLREHVTLSGLALILGAALAIPLGLWLEGRRQLAEPLIRLIGVTQTIPSIALLAFMIPFLGVGARPALVALWVYSLFPMVRNTFTGVRDAAPDAVEAAIASGMTHAQALWRVRLPLAAPVIMAGVRTAAVITIGTATLAALIGAGGLGVPIVSGLQLADTQRILSGAIPAALLAIFVDQLLGWLERRLQPRGMSAT